MKHANLVEPLDLSLIPNVKNLDPRFRNAAYDPGNQYSIPWQWGTTGIGFDKTKVGGTVTDWDAFQLPAVKGKSSFLDEARDAFAMALFALKKDPNTTNDSDLDDAKNYLIDLKKKIKSDHLRLPGPAQERRAPAVRRRTRATCSRSRPTTRTSTT